MLKRSLFLLLVLGVATGTTLAQERILDPEVPAVAAHGKLWYVEYGGLWEVHPETRAMKSFRPSDSLQAPNQVYSHVQSLFTEKDFPGMVRYTSQNSSLVEGEIRFLTYRQGGELWAVSQTGRISIFDGCQWETVEGLCDEDSRHHTCFRSGVVNDDTLRLITCGGVVAIDMRTHEVEHILSVPSWVDHSVRFSGWDTISIESTLSGIIDLASGVNDIDETRLLDMWDDASADSCDGYDVQLPRILALRKALLPSTPWLRSDTLPANNLYLSCRGVRCFRSLTERVYAVDVDPSGTMYVATESGIVVLPDTRGVTIQKEEAIIATTTLAPNPARHWTTVELGDDPIDGTVCQVVDAAGRVVQRLALVERSTRLDISGLAVGMYYVMVASPRSRIVTPLRVSQ